MSLIPVGPCRTLSTEECQPFRYYIVPFDADLLSAGPPTQQLFDHCTGTSATRCYEHFVREFQGQWPALALPVKSDYRPLPVDVCWPNQAIEWFASETKPRFVVSDSAAPDTALFMSRRLLAEIAGRTDTPSSNEVLSVAAFDIADVLSALNRRHRLKPFTVTKWGAP